MVFPRHVTWEPVSIASLAPCPRPASPLCSRPGCSVGFGHGAGRARQHQRRHRGLPVSQAALAGDHLSFSCYTRGGSHISTRVMILDYWERVKNGGMLHMHLVFKRICLEHVYTDIEFVTRVTSLACVKYFWAQVNFSRIKARNYYFCGFRPQML